MIAKESCLRQDRVTKGTVRQKPETAAFAEPGFGSVFRMAIGTTMTIHEDSCGYYIRFSAA
jgi:hypothetical protein